MLSVVVGLRALIYFLEGMTDEETSLSGIIKVSIFIVVYMILRNLTKPFFMKKINRK